MTTLVGYASVYGSTRGVAERVAARLADQGLGVEVRAVDEVKDAARYDAFVLGSAIHNRAWLPEGQRFLRDNVALLAASPVWLFSVGMPGALPRPLRRWAMREGPQAVAEFQGTIHPSGDRLFSGVVRRDQFPFISRVAFRMMGCRYGDLRDWPGIDAWAVGIAHTLRSTPVGRTTSP
jgi:menaquinone-dependent protoporphyrinogen oxidase